MLKAVSLFVLSCLPLHHLIEYLSFLIPLCLRHDRSTTVEFKTRKAKTICHLNALSIDPTPTASPVPSSPSEQIDDMNLGMPSNKASAADKGEKEKCSKWRLSNPFHSKDKDRKDGGPDTELPDTAYASSEPQ